MANLLSFSEFGDCNKQTIYLLAGFPDDTESAWGHPFLNALIDDYHIVAMCFPGYINSQRDLGLSVTFDELTDMLHATVRANSKTSRDKIILVGHDWGAFVALLYQNKYPDIVHKLALFDVGIGFPLQSQSWLQHCVILLYQGIFSLAYWIAINWSHKIGNKLFKLCFVPWLFHSIGPTPYDTLHRPLEEMDVYQCYPYFNFWRNYLLDTMESIEPKTPSCPTLFLFGKRKNAMFHSKSFGDWLKSTPGCSVRSLDCGHWITRMAPTVAADDLKEFIKS